jgi:hypothetical protein
VSVSALAKRLEALEQAERRRACVDMASQHGLDPAELWPVYEELTAIARQGHGLRETMTIYGNRHGLSADEIEHAVAEAKRHAHAQR